MQPNPAITSLFYAQRPWRGAADVQRSALTAILYSVLSVFVVFLPTRSFAQGTSGGGINLVGNGSFESVRTGPETNIISPWFWIYCNDLIVSQPQYVADGNNCAVVCGTIYQDVGVVPGTMYQLRFAFGGAATTPIDGNPLAVSWGTQTVASIPVEPLVTQIPNWRYLTFDVLATADTMRLGFSTLPNQSFPLLDNVSLTAVPEPTVLTLLAFTSLTGLSKVRSFKYRSPKSR